MIETSTNSSPKKKKNSEVGISSSNNINNKQTIPSSNIVANITNPITAANISSRYKLINLTNKEKQEIDIYSEVIMQKEEEILDLHRHYLEMKRERLKTTNDYNYLNNKYRLLQNEEKKTYIKVNKLKKTQDELNNIHLTIQNEKRTASQAKLKIEEDKEYNKIKATYIKQNVNEVNKNWRDKVKIRRIIEQEKIKKEKIRNHSMIELNKEKNIEKKKQLCEDFRIARLENNRKRILIEDQKRNKHILQLKKKIEEESKIKNEFNNKLEEVEKKEIDLINRMKTIKYDIGGKNNSVNYNSKNEFVNDAMKNSKEGSVGNITNVGGRSSNRNINNNNIASNNVKNGMKGEKAEYKYGKVSNRYYFNVKNKKLNEA